MHELTLVRLFRIELILYNTSCPLLLHPEEGTDKERLECFNESIPLSSRAGTGVDVETAGDGADRRWCTSR